ncbi:BQ5605_C014g07702 [Microbotryum silenes-dioicae]|uniref:BQ5605_C014g07702 protein n=1 Tax=Microbotryum silenes-dioicae TaxID=796604 RepID=A0A2X0LYV7_9BASI|nr:BQ5605_C014g07702 [Microbotryum silenes-dioicae]
MSSVSEPDSHNGAGNCLYLKDIKGYKSWASKGYLNLRGDALWDVVIHSVDSLVADYRSTPRFANRRNELACKFLANALSEEQMGHCEHLDSAKDIWDTLKGIHSLGQSSRTMDLLSVLMQPYTGDIIPFKDIVNTVKIAMIDFKNLSMLVRSLPDQYDSIVGNLASDVDVHMDWNAFYPTMNVELADFVARISTTAPKDYFKSYCSRCKVHGHERGWRLCPSRNDNANVSAPPSDSNSNSNVAAIGVDKTALMTYTFPYSKAMPVFPWIIDSGAKVHCVGDKSVISDFISEPLGISVADQSRVNSPGHGSVTFLTSYGCRITLKKVYYMPGAQCGFISIDRLLESMTYVVGPQSNLIFSIRGKSILRSRPGRGFIMVAAPVQPVLSSSPPLMVAANRLTGTCTLMEAHRKLGHQSPAAIVLAVKSGAITGFILKDEKSTKAPHPLYRVFIDLGFVEHSNHHGDIIYLTIVDQHSTAKGTIVLKDKSAETIIGAWTFQAEAERQTGHKIKRVRSDNGCEFDSSLIRGLFEKQVIIVELTAPYAPEVNGQVERLNGSLMGLVQSMLLDSGLPMRFCRMLSPLQLIKVLLGKKPILTHLQPFGSTVFVHVSKERRTMLSPRSIQGVYVSRHVSFVDTSPRAPSVVTSTQDRVDAPIPVFDPRPPPPEMLPVTPVSPVMTPPIGADQPGGDLDVVPPMDEEDEDHDRPRDFHDAEESLDGEAEVALAPSESYAIVRTGPNPGQFENVDYSNILPAGSRRQPQPPNKILPIITAILVNVLDTPPLFHDNLLYDAYCATVFAEEDIEIPKLRLESDLAMVAELRQFDHHGVFQEVTWHEGIWVLGTIWVYNIKCNANGKSIHFKARLVAQGFAQRPGIDYHDTYAPVARSSTILFLIALAAAQGLHLEQFDFDCAFLNGKMSKDIYVQYPKGWNTKGGYKATTASSWVKVKPLRAKSAAQIKTRRAPNADSNGR